MAPKHSKQPIAMQYYSSIPVLFTLGVFASPKCHPARLADVVECSPPVDNTPWFFPASGWLLTAPPPPGMSPVHPDADRAVPVVALITAALSGDPLGAPSNAGPRLTERPIDPPSPAGRPLLATCNFPPLHSRV